MWLPSVRETAAQLLQRALDFLAAVLARPEQHVFIVSHGVFIETLQRCLLQVTCQLDVLDHMKSACKFTGGTMLSGTSASLQLKCVEWYFYADECLCWHLRHLQFACLAYRLQAQRVS
jgi:broad specificity phosphatase PhoE